MLKFFLNKKCYADFVRLRLAVFSNRQGKDSVMFDELLVVLFILLLISFNVLNQFTLQRIRILI